MRTFLSDSFRSLVCAGLALVGVSLAKPAFATDSMTGPDSGYWNFLTYNEQWANGVLENWAETTPGKTIFIADFGIAYIGNGPSSYAICNNSSSDISVTVTYYSGTSWTGSVQETDTWTIAAQNCFAFNSATAVYNQPGSVKITSTTL